MLIRICFTNVFRVVMKNLNIDDYSLNTVSLMDFDEENIPPADLIIFPGSGLFGLSYLGFTDKLESVLEFAQGNNIPVIFSSLGMNNMDADESDYSRLTSIFQKKCVKAVSVREKKDEFLKYAGNTEYEIISVCDPAVWAGYVYSKFHNPESSIKPLVGINVVRGGLFKSNGINWTLSDEEKYLYYLSQELDKSDIDYRFYTNGSTLDNNALYHFRKKYNIPDNKFIFTDTSRELVQTISEFDAVAAVRMHSSIISYALGVPSFNIVWNEKIPEFYKSIGYSERALNIDDCLTDKSKVLIKEILLKDYHSPDPEFLMTLYNYLFNVMKELTSSKEVQIFKFDEICCELKNLTVFPSEDDTDLRFKIKKGEKRYASLFESDIKQKKEIQKLKKELEKTEQKYYNAQKSLDTTKESLNAAKKALEKSTKKQEKMKLELDYLNSRIVVKIYRKLAVFAHKIFKKSKVQNK